MKRAALYMRVSTVDQHPETQLHPMAVTRIRSTWTRDDISFAYPFHKYIL